MIKNDVAIIENNEMNEILLPNSKIKKLASGFGFIEGPVWDKEKDILYFSDIPNNKQLIWSEKYGISLFREPSNKSNGCFLNKDNILIVCEHATSRVVAINRNREVEVLASYYKGNELNSPNDVICSKNGTIIFTDPVFGRKDFFGIARDQVLNFQGVYELNIQNKVLKVLVDDFEQPNGLCLSPDEKKLYINDTVKKHVRVFKYDNGKLLDGIIFAKIEGPGEGVPDGLKCDNRGRVYCTGPGGIHVYNEEGIKLGVIKVPEKTANFNWKNDSNLLYITASTSLYSIEINVKGITQN